MILSEEPYSALLLLFNLHSGHFMSRVWNQTVARGRATALDQLVEACQRHFVDRGRPCTGFLWDEEEKVEQECLLSQTPVPRMVSKECQRFVGKEAGTDARSCQECLKIGETKAVREMGAAVNCKVEILSDEEGESERGKKRKSSGDQLVRKRDESGCNFGLKMPTWQIFVNVGLILYLTTKINQIC